MFSYEIKQLLELRNNLVSVKEYIQIIKSEQVDHVVYSGQQFHIYTTDGYQFVLKIKL